MILETLAKGRMPARRGPAWRRSRLVAFGHDRHVGSRAVLRQDGTRRGAVPVHLGLEFHTAGEGLLAAQPFDECAAQAPAIEVDLAVEQVDLEAQVAPAEGRPAAEAGHGVLPY